MESRHTLFPLVTAIDRETKIQVTGLEPGRAYVLRGTSMHKPPHLWERELAADDTGAARWSERFPLPGEYLLDLFAPTAQRPVMTGHLFALPEGLARRIPLRCDFHTHTYYSDGRQSPTEMAIRGRELGLALLAITDHNRYTPTLEAISGAGALGLNLLGLPGEELSFPTWHMLSIGASAAVMDRFNSEAGQAEVAQAEAALAQRPLAPGLTAAEYAPMRWALDRIHRHGGKAYLCHPYWVASRVYHLDPRLYDQMVADGDLDAIELLGDVEFEDNLLSVARYQDLLLQGHRLPIVGNSDSHGVEHTYGCHWTLALAEERTGASALAAIAEGYSAACSVTGPGGRREGFRAYGSHQMVEYALFLEREFFPLHHAICQQEAQAAYQVLYHQGDRKEMLGHAERMAELYRQSLACAA